MSDTPRTDAVIGKGFLHITKLGNMTDHARELERELNQWKSLCVEFAARNQGVADEDCKLMDEFERLAFDKLKGETK